ncbi:acetylxylan esterase [Jeotgalibaca caeni]|uniref:acetylxylan esterase n=1 Tax=Jeotgalibaca caeni TaxID=3028623 RepID=UPI00237DC3CA|nr:acetylxylan esterase [Jeotgalibaca caeni]MDE1549967.1 acetylxylan esterase [Jeotgalibaca caeni]
MMEWNKWENYRGSGQKPTDFDEWWDNNLKQMNDLPLEYEIIPEAIPSHVANFYHLYFNGVGGARVHCQLITPKILKKKHKGMLLFHGYHTNSGDFQDKIGWAAEGFVVLALDARGQGGLSQNHTQTDGGTMRGLIIRGIEEGRDNLYFRNVFLDTAHAARILQSFDYVDKEKIYAQGASQGGGLTLACAGLVPNLHRVFVSYPFLTDYRKAYQLGAQTSAYEEIPYWFQFRDPLHDREEEIFHTLEYIDIQHFAPRIKASVVWAIGLQDAVCPPVTQFATYNNINAKKEIIVLPEYGHEYLPRINDVYRNFFFDE